LTVIVDTEGVLAVVASAFATLGEDNHARTVVIPADEYEVVIDADGEGIIVSYEDERVNIE
jgi:hypothetical protein